MGTHTYYTHGQACQLLDVDGKTLNKWLEAAGIELQPNPKDTRAKRMTRTQLQRLASLHGKTLPEDDAMLREDVEQAKSLAALTWEVEQLGQGLERLTETMQKDLEQAQETLLTQVQKLLTAMSRQVMDGVGDLLREQSTLLPQISEQISTLIRETQEETLQTLHEQLEERRNDQVAAPTEKSLRPVPTSQKLSAASTSPTQNASRGGGDKRASAYVPEGQTKPHQVPDDLPEGTVTVRTFSERHGTTRDMMGGAIKRGDLQAIERPFGNSDRKQPFFSPEQQDAAVAYLELKMLPVKRCPDCPHSSQEGTS